MTTTPQVEQVEQQRRVSTPSLRLSIKSNSNAGD